ncbi:4328_t:CDS:2 [Paraglomus brasilianum]|uniref:Ubiquinone biosynthesis protein n=1 Tax=Paraglomus brasilianum TaxID=144538 RepID=A0A9N8ZXU1_9GLOM|nr:4328_t:CDS:2 [Paraglomus brasilianum]
MNHHRLLSTSCSLSKSVTTKLIKPFFVRETRRQFKPSFTISQLQNIRSLTSTPNSTESDTSTAPTRQYGFLFHSSDSSSPHFSSQLKSTPIPTPPTPPTPVPARILQRALSFVPVYGWTVETLSKAAVAEGYLSVTHGLFSRGGVDLIDYFLEDCRRKMIDELSGKMDGLKTHEKVKMACVVRLNMMRPYIKKWPEALAIMAHPSNVSMSVGHLAQLVDDIWYLAGDKSADMNWYSKRTELALIYSSTELYMTQDKSPNFEATFKFLDNRLTDVMRLGKAISEIGTFVDFATKSAIGILASKGLKFPGNR